MLQPPSFSFFSFFLSCRRWNEQRKDGCEGRPTGFEGETSAGDTASYTSKSIPSSSRLLPWIEDKCILLAGMHR